VSANTKFSANYNIKKKLNLSKPFQIRCWCINYCWIYHNFCIWSVCM